MKNKNMKNMKNYIVEIEKHTTLEYLISKLLIYRQNLELNKLAKAEFIVNFPEAKEILYNEVDLLKDFEDYSHKLLINQYEILKEIEDDINFYLQNIDYIEKILCERKKWL